MQIAIGADHAGVEAKLAVAEHLRAIGHDVVDLGAHTAESVDYPDVAAEVAGQVAAGRADRGVLICGSGIGVCIAANKVPGIRAGYAFNEESARLAREHNHAQIVCLGARLLDTDALVQAVTAFVAAEYEGGRHDRRVDKIHDIENGNLKT